MTCAVEGDSECDSSNGSLTLHVSAKGRSFLRRGQDESGSRDEAIL